jgi:hypothetical protein
MNIFYRSISTNERLPKERGNTPVILVNGMFKTDWFNGEKFKLDNPKPEFWLEQISEEEVRKDINNIYFEKLQVAKLHNGVILKDKKELQDRVNELTKEILDIKVGKLDPGEKLQLKTMRDKNKQLRKDYGNMMAKYLKANGDKLSLLHDFAEFLEKEGYMDTDWRAEEPFAIDEFIKEQL